MKSWLVKFRFADEAAPIEAETRSKAIYKAAKLAHEAGYYVRGGGEYRRAFALAWHSLEWCRRAP